MARIDIPFVYRASDGSRPLRLAWETVEIEEIEGRDAAVAMTWDYCGSRFAFRAHDGGLWHRSQETYRAPHSLQALMDMRSSGPTAMQIKTHPMGGREPVYPYTVAVEIQPSTADDERLTEFVRRRQTALETAGRAILIDGELWEKSTGPVACLDSGWNSNYPSAAVVHPARLPHAPLSLATACAPEHYLDTHVIVQRAFPDIRFPDPGKIERRPGCPEPDIDGMAAISAAWMARFHSRKFTVSQASPEHMEALLRLKTELARSLPDVDLEINLIGASDRLPHPSELVRLRSRPTAALLEATLSLLTLEGADGMLSGKWRAMMRYACNRLQDAIPTSEDERALAL